MQIMFENRQDAGRQLAEALKRYRDDNPVILAIPRGGIIPGVIAALKLEAEFSVIITRKLGLPSHPESAFGALAEDKSLYLDPMVREVLSKELIEKVIVREEKEIRRRIQLYRNGDPLPVLTGRTVILVDDGIVTGSTVMVAIELCKKQKAKKIVVAAPVSGKPILEKLKTKADEVVILDVPEEYYAVSQAYRKFSNLSDNEVLRWLQKAMFTQKSR
ncbi:MAG: phosphoribosyltransferase family protein [Balneolaceae bacterium]|nr:phosphoribosyltransferase family protein [Balneolaceae bacterium]